jgi:hypothetical protein
VPRGDNAIGRAKADVQAGDFARARLRLRGYLVNDPTSREARLLLADLYRRDGYPDEAGRWGYLFPDASSTMERAAYERSCAHRLGSQWTSTYIRRGLHWPAGVATHDPEATAIIARLDERAAREATDWWEREHKPWQRWMRRLRWPWSELSRAPRP